MKRKPVSREEFENTRVRANLAWERTHAVAAAQDDIERLSARVAALTEQVEGLRATIGGSDEEATRDNRTEGRQGWSLRGERVPGNEGSVVAAGAGEACVAASASKVGVEGRLSASGVTKDLGGVPGVETDENLTFQNGDRLELTSDPWPKAGQWFDRGPGTSLTTAAVDFLPEKDPEYRCYRVVKANDRPRCEQCADSEWGPGLVDAPVGRPGVASMPCPGCATPASQRASSLPSKELYACRQRIFNQRKEINHLRDQLTM